MENGFTIRWGWLRAMYLYTLIGAGGLGAPLQTGITTGNDLLILVTGCWVTFLAVGMDGIAGGFGRFVSVRFGGRP